MRRFRALFEGLPASARVWHEENSGWTNADRFAAINAMQTNSVFRAVLASIPTKTRKKLPPPLVIELPGAKKPRKAWVKEWATAAMGGE